MALDLGTVLTVVEMVQKSIEIYKRYQGLPQQMAQLGRRMQRLEPYLRDLEGIVKRKPTTAFETLYSGQRKQLIGILADIRIDATKVYDLFERYEKGILSRSMNIEFRAKWMSKIWFSLIDNSPEKVQAIMEDIDTDRDELRHSLQLMDFAVNLQALDGVQTIIANMNAAPRKSRERTKDEKATARPLPSPSPSPATPRRDYKILFVDPYNTARSVVAEALLKLFGELTRKTGGDWRISQVESAGFFLKKAGNCADIIDGLDYSFKSFKMPWKWGNEKPASTALAAVFDNKWCDHPFKKTIQEEVAARGSRGLQKDMFTRFDYVVVFTRREHDNMVKLKDAIQKMGGPSKRGKGRVLQLGTFLSQERGVLREILHTEGVNSDVNSAESRRQWNQKVAEIKTALKELLKKEMEWKQPDKKVAGGQKKLEAKKA